MNLTFERIKKKFFHSLVYGLVINIHVLVNLIGELAINDIIMVSKHVRVRCKELIKELSFK